MKFKTRIKAAIRKNLPEVRALITGAMPRFVYGGGVSAGTVPVFVFHEVEPGSFEEKLSYLKENGYTTLDASELSHCLNYPTGNYSKKVVLTFDDGHISLWQHAYPLLREYNFQAVSFVCPGLVPEKQNNKSVDQRRILCNWGEIQKMHDSGHVDFQSHSMYHDLVFTSDTLIDFYNPNFCTHYLGKRDIPVVLQYEGGFSMTNLWPFDGSYSESFFGMPVFEHAPRYSTEWMYQPAQAVIARLCDFVASNGGVAFFKRKNWNKRLQQIFIAHDKTEKGRFISEQDYQNVLEKDLRSAQHVLEDKLSDKQVTHFCCPWYTSAKMLMNAAYASGYASIFLGEAPDYSSESLRVVRRVSEKYLQFLPGRARKNLLEILSV